MTDDRPVAELVREHLANRDRYAAWRYAGNEPWSGPVPVAPPVPYDNRAWDWLRSLLAERDALESELADTRKLLDPAVVAAAKSLERNADTHPDGCCSVCTEGLAERDALRQRVTKLEETANRLAALHALEHRALMEKYNA